VTIGNDQVAEGWLLFLLQWPMNPVRLIAARLIDAADIGLMCTETGALLPFATFRSRDAIGS
jgi:hypothetical protein